MSGSSELEFRSWRHKALYTAAALAVSTVSFAIAYGLYVGGQEWFPRDVPAWYQVPAGIIGVVVGVFGGLGGLLYLTFGLYPRTSVVLVVCLFLTATFSDGFSNGIAAVVAGLGSPVLIGGLALVINRNMQARSALRRR